MGGADLVHVGCWARARSKFVDAVSREERLFFDSQLGRGREVNQQDGEAIKLVTRMGALFLVDRQHRQRQQQALLVNLLRPRFRVLPLQSALGQAVTYTLSQWAKLRRCFDYAEVGTPAAFLVLSDLHIRATRGAPLRCSALGRGLRRKAGAFLRMINCPCAG